MHALHIWWMACMLYTAQGKSKSHSARQKNSMSADVRQCMHTPCLLVEQAAAGQQPPIAFARTTSSVVLVDNQIPCKHQLSGLRGRCWWAYRWGPDSVLHAGPALSCEQIAEVPAAPCPAELLSLCPTAHCWTQQPQQLPANGHTSFSYAIDFYLHGTFASRGMVCPRTTDVGRQVLVSGPCTHERADVYAQVCAHRPHGLYFPCVWGSSLQRTGAHASIMLCPGQLSGADPAHQ